MSAFDRIAGGAPKTASTTPAQAPQEKKSLFQGIEDFTSELLGGKKTSKPTQETPTPAPVATTTSAFSRLTGSASKTAPQPSAKPTETPSTSAFSRLTSKTGPSYYGTTTPEGISFGPSPEKDKSGRPFIEYKLPGQTASTTDKTRTSVTFNPMVASPQTKETFYNPRAVENKDALRIALGGAYSDELDHKIAVALSGSNDVSNLRAEPASKNNDSGKILELQQKVVKGQMSLFDAQVELAKWKGIDIPWTPKETKKYSSFDGALAAFKDAWTNKAAPAIDSLTARRDQSIEQPYFEPRKATETQAQYSARLQTFQNSPEMKAYQEKVKKANSFGGIVSETVKNLPNKFIENPYATLGFGAAIKGIRDNPEDAANIQPMDAVKALPGAVYDVGTGFVKAPVSGALNIYGAAAGAMFNDPAKGAVKFSIPGLGEFSNANARVIDRINAGEDPTQVALEEGSQSIFDTLFFFGVASKAFAPRTSVTARFQGDLNAIKKEGAPAIDMGPRSFREYTPPSTAAPLTPKVLNAMSEQGMSLGPKYDPTLPSFFRIRATGKGGGVIGEVVQIKPSYFDVLVSKITPKTQLDYFRTAVKNSEAVNVDAAIKSGDIPKEAVYKKGKILTEDFAKGRVDDVAQKLDMYKPGLGNEFKAKVDVSNTSLPGIIEQGEAMLTPDILKNPNPQIQSAIIAEKMPTVPTRLVNPVITKEVPLEAVRSGLENPAPAPQEAPTEAQPQITTPNPLESLTGSTASPSRYQALPPEYKPTEPTASDINPVEVVSKHSAAQQAQEVAAEAKVDQDLKIYQKKENLPAVYEQQAKNIEHSLKMADTPEEVKYWNQQLRLAKYKVDYVKKRLSENAPDKAPELPKETATSIETVRQVYKDLGNDEYGMSKADNALGQILVELELAEKGERIMTPSNEPGVNYTFHAKRSTFPDWIPENLRSRKAIDTLLARIESIDTLSYPEKTTATAQRDFVNALLDTLDYRLGVDTSEIRAKIKSSNEKPAEKSTAKSGATKEVSKSSKGGSKFINESALNEAKSELKENRARRAEIKAELDTTEDGPTALKLTAEQKKLEERAKVLSRIIKDAENLSQVAAGPVKKQPAQEVAKVEEEPSEPIVKKTLYHGTLNDFQEFSLKKAGSNTEWKNASFGIFFIDDPARAKTFVEDTRPVADTRPVIIKEAHVDIKNPIDLTLKGILTKESQASVIVKMMQGENMSNKAALELLNETIDLGTVSEMFDELYSNINNKRIMMKAGYDGIVSDFGKGEDGTMIKEYVAFEPSQVKVIEKTSNSYPNINPEPGVTIYGRIKGDTATLESIEIKKSLQGKGLGKKYFADFENWAKENGAKYIKIDAYKKSIGFWEKQGFNLEKDFPVLGGVIQDYKSGIKEIGATKTPEEVKVPKKPINPEKVPEHNMFEKAWEMKTEQTYEKTRAAVERVKGYLEEAKKLKPEVDKIPRNYSDRTPAQRELKMRYETLSDKRNKEFYDFWTGPSLRDPSVSRLEALKEPTESMKTSYRKQYIADVKKFISQGYDIPQEMINQFPELVTAATARARYEKGYKTSFANKSAGIDETTKKEYGFKVKRQDGKPITEAQIGEITGAADDLAKAIGPFKDVAEKLDLTVAHTSGKFPFLRSDAGGLHIGTERTISIGVKNIKAFAHEMMHVFDNASGTMGQMITKHISRGGKYNESLISRARQEMNGSSFQIDKAMKLKPNMTQEEKDMVQLMRGRLTGYYRTSTEIFARLGEQYVADKLGLNGATDSPAYYEQALGYWSKDVFDELKPMIEAEIENKITLAREALGLEKSRFRFDRTGPAIMDATTDEVLTEVRKLFSPDEVNVVFKKEFIARPGLQGRFRHGADIVNGDVSSTIELLTKGDLASRGTAWHESFHAYFNLYVTPKRQQIMLNKVKALSVITKSGRYRDMSAYDTADKRAEEFMADDFEDYMESLREGGKKYEGFFASLWSKFVSWLKNLRRRILGLQKIYDDILAGKRPNGGRVNREVEVSRSLEFSDEDMKHIADIIEQGATKAEAKAQIEQNRIRMQNQARTTRIPDETLRQVFQNTLNPLKGVDPEAADIFRKWHALELSGEEMARLEKKAAEQALRSANVPDNMDTINRYEAGQGGLPAVRAIFDSLYAEAGRLDDTEVGYLENYIPHVYSNSAAEFHRIAMSYLQGKGLSEMEAEDYLLGKKALPQAQARRLGLLPFFVKERMFDSYKEAIAWGLRPKYKTVSDLAAYYRGKLERALANRYLKDTLEEKGKILPDVQAPSGWSNLNPQFSALSTYKAPAQVARVINDIFPDANIRRLGSAILEKTARISRGLQEITLSGGVPSSNVNFFSNGQLIKEITAGNPEAAKAYLRANSNDLSLKYFDEKAPVIMKMAQQGIDLSGRIGKWGHQTFGEMVQNKEWARAFGRGFDIAFNEKTFASFLPQLQIGLFEKIYNKAIANGMPENVATKLAGDTVKNNFGLLTDDFARSKTVRDFLSTFFFAPKFREGILRMLANAGYAGYDFVRNPRRPNPAYRRNLYFLAGLAITYALYNMVNKQLNGNYLWDNPDGREFALRIPRDNGDVLYIEILPGTMAFPRALATGIMATGRGDIKMATQKFGMLLSQPVHLVTDVLGNEDYYGRPIYKDTDTAGDKATKIAEYMGLNATHPWVREIVNQVEEKNPLYQSVSASLELPFKFSSLSKEAQARIYAEVDRKAKELAASKKAFEPTYNAIRDKVDAGDTVGALNDIRALSKEQQAIYKAMKADEQAVQNKAANKAVAPSFEAIQELIKEGKTTEAMDMYRALPADQKKAYQRFKKKTQ